MHRLFSSRKHFIGLGAMSALVIALAVLGTLWGFSQRASANDNGPVPLVHVEPGGGDYTGNPYCPDTDWTATKSPAVNPAHDCNNITSQNHVIRTEGWVPYVDGLGMQVVSWNIENFSGGNATIISQGQCDALDLLSDQTDVDTPIPPYDADPWDEANNTEQCVIIHSSTPGETRVTLTYDETVSGDPDVTTQYAAGPVIKEWDSIVDSVILKDGDLGTKAVKVYHDETWDEDGDTVVDTDVSEELWLPKDEDGDGDRDADDEHLLDKQGEWQDHAVIWDEAVKRIKRPVPVQITEIVHGEHEVLIDSVSEVTHQPTEGALVEAVIESERGCTFFTDATGSLAWPGLGSDDVDGNRVLPGVSDNLGRVTIYLDTKCEEQAVINFYANFPPGTGSLREGLHEWVGINWTTIELAKQPQIRWAGEEIVLAKRWALPDGPYFPNETCDVDGDGVYDEVCPSCPYVGALVKYVELDGPGGLVSGLPELANPLLPSEPDIVYTTIDENCVSRALYSSEGPGQVDVEALLLDEAGQVMNKHAFLVWYLKVYQVKLTNVDGERADHNAGDWSFGDGEDTVEDTLNVSQDALLRVTVKGWFEGGNNSGRGAVCVDMDGDGNGLEGEDATEPGEPYPVLFYEDGCDDVDDEILDHGHWVLPDDLPALAGPDAINTRPNWDVMSEPDDSSTDAVGPKSTLDSHDDDNRPYVPFVDAMRKTIAPDGAITAADAIMPPLKIRASIADADAGFLKQALKDVVYGSTNDYHSIMIPASPEIPPIVNNGGYDWDSWVCHDAINLDIDGDGVANADDNCPADANENQEDLDVDDDGDACDTDDDADTVLDASDNCPLVSNPAEDCDSDPATPDEQCDTDGDGVGDACDNADAVAGTAATDLDSDADTVVDGADNCPTDDNEDQADADDDGYGDVCDYDPANPPAPPVCVWTGLALGPYEFWTIINKFGAPNPNYIEFYTDNRGEGMFFANGDYNLSFDCPLDPVSGTPVCDQGDVVGESNITVIGDYPYFRKHSAVQSNDVVKTWEWGGFKSVSHERIDATHIKVIATLLDRDGFCKSDVDVNADGTIEVVTSPSEYPVQGEEIEFILNTEVGSIIDISPNGLYNPPAPHDPLTEAVVTGYEDGVMINRSEAVALAEDARVLEADDDADAVCTAWVVIQHPLGEDPDVSVILHDPEGDVVLHWPVTELIVGLVQGWNDVCYVDEDAAVEDAIADIIDDVLAVYLYDATDTEDAWKAFFPDNADLSDLDVLLPYDQLFILMAASADWTQAIQALPDDVVLEGASAEDEVAGAWNSVCYAGPDKATEEATSDISSAFVVMYTLGSDQAWRRYVPGRPEIPDTLTTLHRFDSVILLVTAEGPITWVFDP